MTLKELLTIDTSDAAANAARDKEVEEIETRLKEEKKQADYEKIAPARYWSESLQTYNVTNQIQRDALATVLGFVHAIEAGLDPCLVLLGNAGIGKTHLACGALREVGGRYYLASEIIDELRRVKAFSSHETEAERLKRYAEYKLVVIDEVGRGQRSNDEQYALYQIINARYNAKRATLLISNFNRANFLNFIGAAAQDRILENGFIHEFTCASYREQIRGQSNGL